MNARFFLSRLLLPTGLVCGFALMQTLAQTPPTASPATTATPAKKQVEANSEAKSSAEPQSPSQIDEQAQTDREAAAWGFVMKHHPQLGEVLSRLKIMHLGQYEKAINQITLSAERIARLQKTDAKRGDMELEDWKLASQIQLAAAKLSLSREDAELQQELAKIVRKQLEHRLKITEYERDKMQARLKLLDEQVAKQKETLAKSTDARVTEMLREVNKARKNLQNENNNPKKAAKGKAAE